ncbi:MAG: hypothetical protein ABIZ91_05035 [Gemmatimonadaceae bacterium]
MPTPDAPEGRYWPVLLQMAPRLLGLLDRERLSPTRGSFDRVHWAWKFRDFPLTMWQSSMMTLATLYRTAHPGNIYAARAPLAEWIRDAVSASLDRQHRNGAFDSFTPYSQDHGVTLAMVLSLATTARTLGDELPDAMRDRLHESVRRACRFAAHSDEDYAFINNHQAAFALAYLRAGRLLGDGALVARSEAVIETILRHQSPDGWFEEYRGPDPGYETFGLTYLALYEAERPTAALQAALARSVHFLSHCVHPDGSIGGNYGSRHTSQYAPGGLELLASRIPMAGAIADYVGQRMPGGNVVVPLRCDDDNLPLLTFSYAVAATMATARASGGPLLPCQRSDVLTRFDDSRIVVAATQRYFAVGNLSKGGVLRVFDREREELAYEDSGFALATAEGQWVSHHLGESEPGALDTLSRPTVVAHFAALKHEVLTPVKFLVLRILNLTVFRSVRLGALVRRMIIARLITGRQRGPWTLRRALSFEGDRIIVEDEVVPQDDLRVTFASLERSLLPMHMGSAKYFHASELIHLAPAPLDGWTGTLSAGQPCRLRQVITFGADHVVRVERSTGHHMIGLPLTDTKERTTA